MANHVDPVPGHHTSQEIQLSAVPDPPSDQPDEPPKQGHAEDHTEQTEAARGEHGC